MGVFTYRLRRNLIGPIALRWKVKKKKKKYEQTNTNLFNLLMCDYT